MCFFVAGVDEANGACLVRAVASIYDDLLLQGKPPLAAYDLLITTLRSHFARETWPDLVDVSDLYTLLHRRTFTGCS